MLGEKLKCYWQHLLPQHLLSRLVAKLANCKIPFIKNGLIKLFIHHYKIDLNTAAITELSAYPNFNSFFTRELKAEARPIMATPESIVSPADGTISQFGRVTDGQLLQAKGHLFSVAEFLGGAPEVAAPFQNGHFMTIYLAPKDYHRVHMPIDGKLITTISIPGKLFSVNCRSVAHVPKLFSRNERLVSLFDTEIGPMALVMVGAMLVAGIETVWSGQESPNTHQSLSIKTYQQQDIVLCKGAEMGRFQFGSTVILLWGANVIEWLDWQLDQNVKVGELLGYMIKRSVTTQR
jgi:phosphatidylserine decarboxylase